MMFRNESLVKCTGVHVAALGTEGSFAYQIWQKEPEFWQPLVAALDAQRDVVLFPGQDCIYADEFPWSSLATDDGRGNDSRYYGEVNRFTLAALGNPGRWRLVVLEASWNYARTMAAHIVEYRQRCGLAPLLIVALRSIVGEYWRFQPFGHTAVSTIEAIARTARAAGASLADEETLLLLFRLQKFRVLQRAANGGKVPRAVDVTGDGIGSWKHVIGISPEPS